MHRIKRKKQRGMALLMVMGMLAMLITVIVDFQFNSRIDLQRAINARDEVQAEYNALSAIRTRMVILRVRDLIKSALGTLGNNLPIGQILEMVPVECGLLSQVIKQNASEKDVPENFFAGECLSSMSSEHSKIPLNALRNTSSSQQIQTILLSLLSDKSLEKLYQTDDKSGTHAQTPQELVGAIIDWVDMDKNAIINQSSDENRAYDRLRDPYKAKNAPFDSIAELQLVHGISDALFRLLKNHVTIYNDTPRIELSSASYEQIFLGLQATFVPGLSFLQVANNPGFPCLFQAVQTSRQMGTPGFGALTVGTMKALVTSCGLGGIIDNGRIDQVFGDGSGTTWFTLEAEGQVGNANRKIRAVYQTYEGQLYYIRIE